MRTAAQKVRRALIEIGVDQPGLPRLLRPDIINYRGTPVRRVTRDGITYDLDLSDYVEWTIYWGVERTEKAALFDLANHGDVALDIGTNVGEVLMKVLAIKRLRVRSSASSLIPRRSRRQGRTTGRSTSRCRGIRSWASESSCAERGARKRLLCYPPAQLPAAGTNGSSEQLGTPN